MNYIYTYRRHASRTNGMPYFASNDIDVLQYQGITEWQ